MNDSTPWTRRRFLQTVGQAGGAAAAYEVMVALGMIRIPSAFAALPELPPDHGAGKRVVILGAGIAGLTAAYELNKAGYEVVILEAHNRAGPYRGRWDHPHPRPGGTEVYADMEQWAEIRRRVLTGEISKRQACAEYEIHWRTLTKILSHAEPPGFRLKGIRRGKLVERGTAMGRTVGRGWRPGRGPFLGVLLLGGLLTAVSLSDGSVESVALYAEMGDTACLCFVRDRGRGFDLDAVGDDRQGLRGSIIGRIERHGGQVSVRSAPGTGTEVEIRMPR